MPEARLVQVVQNGDVGESDEAHIDRGRELEEFRNQELAERAQSEERKRISRELHDRVAHDMAVAHQSLQLYEAFKEQDPERAAQKMETAKEAIERAMRSTRDLSQALQETEIVDGLDSPLLGVLREVLPPGVKSNLTVEGDWKHLTPRTRDQIYLPRGAASTEEILLRQRQLLTGYQYFFEFGFSYTFGSIFNNIVNPRFGGGG